MTGGALNHDPADAALIADVVELGALPPAFTRHRHPGFWDCWEEKAFAVRDAAGTPALAAAINECDRYSGQPLVPQPAPKPIRSSSAHASLDAIELLRVSLDRFFQGAPA